MWTCYCISLNTCHNILRSLYELIPIYYMFNLSDVCKTRIVYRNNVLISFDSRQYIILYVAKYLLTEYYGCFSFNGILPVEAYILFGTYLQWKGLHKWNQNVQYNNATCIILKLQFKSSPNRKEYNATANYTMLKVGNILEQTFKNSGNTASKIIIW